ncbi:hypothetical protein [Streptomyces sp. CA-146814]|uniref:hypothetical protein n=1 Tax=Streptomyces sp. CA-146814 TaxID=3240053 RepID=UPI003D94FF25
MRTHLEHHVAVPGPAPRPDGSRTTNTYDERTRARAHTHPAPEGSGDGHHQGRGRPRRSAARTHGLRQLLGRRPLHGDDAGQGIVYGTEDSPLAPAARRLLNARANAAKSGDTLPAAFDAEAACDLDRDGFTDLIVSTDPPYNGVGAPPVPLQILFGSPDGLAGRAVTGRIPAEDLPEAPLRTKGTKGTTRTTLLARGDFDGDKKATDTVVRTYRGEREDLIALYAAGSTDDPVLTFSTTLFLP